jgi:hypothetical protein
MDTMNISSNIKQILSTNYRSALVNAITANCYFNSNKEKLEGDIWYGFYNDTDDDMNIHVICSTDLDNGDKSLFEYDVIAKKNNFTYAYKDFSIPICKLPFTTFTFSYDHEKLYFISAVLIDRKELILTPKVLIGDNLYIDGANLTT